jgi:hypothetical protein
MRCFVLVVAFFLSSAAFSAGQNWELCLDKADFYFSVDGFLGSTSATKSGCKVKFAHSGGKGEKFEFDLCDPLIHVDYYPTIDSDSPHRIQAGSAGCPSPLFGADFDTESRSFSDYRDTIKKAWEIWDKVKAVYGEGADKVNLSNPQSFSPEVSAGKIACGQHLLKEYLTNCMAFEARKMEPAEAPKPDIPGIHPQTILAPKK